MNDVPSPVPQDDLCTKRENPKSKMVKETQMTISRKRCIAACSRSAR